MTSHRVPSNLRNLMEALKVFLTGDTGKRGNSMMAYLCMIALGGVHPPTAIRTHFENAFSAKY
ncbi:MAG TPA: hypothetical protein PKA27_15195 [Fimbriimonadaceae bacterium]|nr:hypothetical protein [Fimbriimonadaceae bacterium]